MKKRKVKDSVIIKAISITSSFEGASYSTVATNFDGAVFSVGILQWNVASGTLHDLLLESYKADSRKFVNIFGVEESKRLLAACEKKELEYFKSFYSDPRKLDMFKKKLRLWGATYADLQKAHARMLVPKSDSICAAFGLHSERAFCWAYDLVVQNGSMGSVAKLALQRLKEERGKNPSLPEVVALRILTEIRATVVNQKWRSDFLARKMTIIRGSGVVHGARRDLFAEYGLSDEKYYIEEQVTS